MKDDVALVVAALSGGPEMFSPIVERYQDAVFAVALARLRNFDDAEDIAQEVFIEAFKHLDRLDNPSRLGAWLRSIAIHRCIDHLRRRREVIDVAEIAEQVEATSSNPHTEIEQQELRAQVMAAIGRLSKKQRETTTLFYINGYSQEEIARIQEAPIGTVRRRLHDARQKLKEEMIGVVEDVLKSGAPKEDFGEQVFEILSRYRRPATPWGELDEIASTLREIGTAGFDGFMKALKSPYYQTRRFAVRILPASGQSDEAIEELLKKALKDTNKKVRKIAFLGLAHIIYEDESKRKDIVPCLLPLLTDPSWRIRSYVASQLYGQDYFEGYAEHVPLDCVVRAFLDEKDRRVRRHLEKLMRAVLDAQESNNSKE
jgi:RNA polymerase sigma-70 factor (ECF subfamily)